MAKMKDKCLKYGLAITDYVIGEEMDITYDELLQHLRQCATCRDDLLDWQNTYAALRTDEYQSRPEVRSRMNKFINEVVYNSESPTLPPVIDSEKIVGTAAGKIYDCLKTNGPVMPIPLLRKKTKLTGYPFYQSIGWLERENKILTRGVGDPEYAELRKT